MPHHRLRGRIADELQQLAIYNTYDDSPDRTGLADDIRRLGDLLKLLATELDRLDEVELALVAVRDLPAISTASLRHSGARLALDRIRERVVLRSIGIADNRGQQGDG